MKKLILGTLLTFSVNTFANALYCGGKITGVYVSAESDLIIRGDWRGDWTRLCNLKSDATVNIVTCSLWASYAASALQNDTSVLLLYTASTNFTQCTQVPTYQSSPTPHYFMLTK